MTVSGIVIVRSPATAGVTDNRLKAVKAREKRMRVLHRPSVDCSHTGFSPTLRFTSPGARAQSRWRPVSWLAGLRLGPAFSPFRAMAIGPGSPLTVARAAAFRQFPFQPVAGPPSSGVDVAQLRRHVRPRNAASAIIPTSVDSDVPPTALASPCVRRRTVHIFVWMNKRRGCQPSWE